jgi:hypothetical protein
VTPAADGRGNKVYGGEVCRGKRKVVVIRPGVGGIAAWCIGIFCKYIYIVKIPSMNSMKVVLYSETCVFVYTEICSVF